MKYKIVKDHDMNNFLKAVRDLISEGWQPQGGLSISAGVIESESEAFILYGQAMVKDD